MLRQRARTPVEALRKRSFGMDCRIKAGNDERNERKKRVGSETPTGRSANGYARW
jgi:hypothetical protein